MSEPAFTARAVLRPRSMAEVLDLSVLYLRTHLRDFLPLSLGIVALGVLSSIVLRHVFRLHWGIIWAVVLPLGVLAEQWIVAFTADHLFKSEASISRAAFRVGRRLPLLFLVAILFPLPWLPNLATKFDAPTWLVIGVFTCMSWPGLVAICFFFPTIVLLEWRSTKNSVSRMLRLINRRYGRTLMFILLWGVGIRLFTVFSFEIASQFISSFLLQIGSPLDSLHMDGGSHFAVAGYFFASSLIGVTRLFEYVDARTAIEGWDIQVRFSRLAHQATQQQRAAA